MQSCDIINLPLEKNTIDQVVFCFSLHHVNNRSLYLKEANRILKDKIGKLRIIEPESKTGDTFVQVVEQLGFVC